MIGAERHASPGEADAGRWFFENSRDLFCVAGLDGALRQVNRAWTEVTGWTPDDLLGRTTFNLTHPDDRPGFAAMLQDLAAKREAVTVARLQAKDGRWLWFDGRTRITAQGELVGIMRDITAERAREEELQAARRTQTMLSEAAGIGAWTFEPKTGLIAWSMDVLSLFGWSETDIDTPEKFLAVLDERQRDGVNAAFMRGVETGEGTTIEHRMRAADGRWLTMRATFRTEKRGRLFALKGISQDVTELAAARDAALRGQQRIGALAEELSASSVRLKMALGAADAGAFEIDHVGRSLWGSDQFYDLMGRRIVFEDIVKPDWMFAHPDDRATVRAVRDKWMAGDSAHAVEFRVVRADDEERWVRVYYVLDSTTRRGVGLAMDIDARKRQELALVAAERAAQVGAEAKASFLANMSHELRTPMNGVLGIMHLLEREPLSAGGQALLAEAMGCGQMLTALLDDVVDFSRIEAGKLDINLEPVDVAALAQGVIGMLQPLARGKDIVLRLEGAADLGWAITDGVRLRQALFNLIGNAVKFTLHGHVAVYCRRDGEQLCFAIQDTGVGIPLAAQAGLFQRFTQADASTTRQFGGSGLGLTITRRLAEMMGGDVSFTSAVGAGSTFRLSVLAPPARTAGAVVAAPSDGILDGLKVLVVEDNATNRMIAVRLLETLGAVACTAPDGVSGVEMAAMGVHDLVLMDIQMPGIDGLEATRRIRSLGTSAALTPIIALTANVMSHQRRAYLAAGMQGVVSKPLSPTALLAEIVRVSQAADETLGEPLETGVA